MKKKNKPNKPLDLIRICRPNQWYKNIVIFLPLIFVLQLFNLANFTKVLIGFFSLAFMSSVNYIINDLKDRNQDRSHPEKKHRPIASGRVKGMEAIILAVLLFALSVYIAFNLSKLFLVSVLFLFAFTQIYTFYLKNEVFADVIGIAVNFVNRSVAGAFIIQVVVSPWLILCTFFLAIFLAIAKRQSDIILLKDKARNHKKVLAHYTPELTNALMIISTTALILSYALYSFLRNQEILMITLPFSIYVVLRYFDHAKKGSVIARHPEKFYKDKKMVAGILLWVVATIILLYYSNFIINMTRGLLR